MNLLPILEELIVEQGHATERLVSLQRAFLLGQLEGTSSKGLGALNKFTAAVRRELQLSSDVANKLRADLADQGYLEPTKAGRKISYRLTEAGQAYLNGLERPELPKRTRSPASVDETSIPGELREAQTAYLLLQVLDADGQALTKAQANKIPTKLRASLGFKASLANCRRATLTEQGYIQTTRNGRSEQYALTPDGMDYLIAKAHHLDHVVFSLKGKTLNVLTAAARESLFKPEERDLPPVPPRMPSQVELAAAVLVEFQQLQRESHGRTGLVPIYELRERIASRFGPAAASHEVLDEVILDLWRQHRVGLEAISDFADMTEQQLNDGIPRMNDTFFYLEAPRGQPVTQ